MGNRFRSRWALLAVLAGAVVGSLATIPASGSHFDPATSDVLRLHLGADGTYFRYEAVAGGVPDVTQTIPAPVRCEADLDGDLVTATASDRGPGLVTGAIGVKSGGSQGTPCGQVDSTEDLTLTLAGVLPAVGAELDLELKGDVDLRINLSNGETYIIRSGAKVVDGQGVDGVPGDPYSVSLDSNNLIGNCRIASDSGPDSGPNDNCRVKLHPDDPFTSIEFAPVSGQVSLEGGGDFSPASAKYDTIFYLQSWDGLLDCGQTETREEGDVLGVVIRHDNVDGSSCVEKLFLLRAQNEDAQLGDSVIFEFRDPEEQPGFYEAEVHFTYDLNGEIFTGNLLYDPNGADGYDDFVAMPACDQYPFQVDGDGNPIIVDGLKVPIRDTAGNIPFGDIVPDGHQGCVFFATQDMSGETVWHAVFSGDWGFRPG